MSTTSTPEEHQPPIPNYASTFTGPQAKSYNARTGGCNIHLATHLISLVLPSLPAAPAPLRILDNASGPAVLTSQCLISPAITSNRSSLHISAVDISPDFVAANRAFISHLSLPPSTTVDTHVMDAQNLDFHPDTFDLSFTSLALFAMPDPVRAAAEIHRTLKPGGVAAVSTWKRQGWLPLLHQVEARLRPGRPLTEFPHLELWGKKGMVESTLRQGGFERVREGSVAAVAWFESGKEAARRVCETLGMMIGEGWGVEEMEVGFRDMIAEGGGGVLKGKREEGREGWVGFEGEAWTGVGWK